MGRMVELPALGPSREKYDKMMTGFTNFVNFYTIWMEFNSDFQKVFVEAMNRVQEKITNEMQDGIGPDKYKELYNIWIETYSSTFKEFLKSGHFASDMGKFMSYFLEFQKYNREMLEENYLKQMSLPTKTDIDEINRELYALRKKTKELARQIEELSKNRQSTL
jgi:class III poly(R)-hydroxyalkanoic acid synthase PhaE subunit